MARHKEKMLDPEWQAARRKDHHRLKTAVTVRIDEEEKAQWKLWAQVQGMPLAHWVIRVCREAGAKIAEREGEDTP